MSSGQTPRHRWALAAIGVLGAGAVLFLGFRLGTASAQGEVAHPTAGAAVNRLAHESSPYLRLHQHNPVDWYPWGDEALAKARREDKPIFLSVGYSTCYWCHVMERKVFSDPEIAAVMNREFVNIKVDREERPDLDEIYMTATQLIARHGGWPNSVFLTPELKPFFAGTYFPPEDMPGRPGFPSVLRQLTEAWRSQRAEVESHADQVAEAIRRTLDAGSGAAEAPPPATVAEQALEGLRKTFDREHGGFGPAPKFPSPSNLLLLLEWAPHRPEAEEMLAVTLDAMARGGMYDQLAGGFHRYSTDAFWRLPHFEKMLYDNGLLLEVYARWHARSGDPQAARILRQTAAFLAREMTSPEGGLWSAIDAETEAEEGAFYVWSRGEIETVLGEADAAFLAPIYGFDGEPSFEGGRHVLHLPAPLASRAGKLDLTLEALTARIDPLRSRLLATRARRQRPLTDDKVLADWNGLAIAGLAEAGAALGAPGMVEQAAAAARFVLERMRPEGRPLQHVHRLGEARIDAYLADYAYLIHGLLALHRATGAERWRRAARQLTDEQIRRLGAPEGGFFVSVERPDLLFRSKDPYDGALPSANGIAALNLLELAAGTGEERWRREAARVLRAFAPAVERVPNGLRTLALASRRFHASGDPPPPTTKAIAAAVEPPAEPPSARPEALADQVVAARALLGGNTEGPWHPLTVELEIAEGWHVNANPASDERLIPTQLEERHGRLREIRYPAGQELRFAFADGPIAVYDGAVELAAELLPAGPEPAVLLRYQACDDRRCLPPIERVLPIDRR